MNTDNLTGCPSCGGTPEYGQRVTATATLKRQWLSGGVKTWEERTAVVSGIYLGTRTLRNGRVTCYHDEGYAFHVTDVFKAALVSPGPNRNPVYVPLTCIQPELTS
jgi:hypothetical protein